MTIVLDASALLALHIDSPARATVLDAMNGDTTWCACAVALPEAIAAAARLTDEPVLVRELEDMVRHTWDFLHVVPADRSLLDEATTLANRALETLERLHGPDAVEITPALSTLGRIHEQKGAYAQAETSHRRTLAMAPSRA